MILGITGMMGSGKSTAGDMISAITGAPIVDADVLAREIIVPNSTCIKQIEEDFGQEYILADGTLHRQKLADRVFADEAELDQLCKIVMPHIRTRAEKQLVIHGDKPLVIWMAPLMFEEKMEDLADLVLVVAIDQELSIRRAMERSNWTREHVEQRMKRQIDQEWKISRADFVIWNNGKPHELQQSVTDFILKLKSRLKQTSCRYNEVLREP